MWERESEHTAGVIIHLKSSETITKVIALPAGNIFLVKQTIFPLKAANEKENCLMYYISLHCINRY